MPIDLPRHWIWAAFLAIGHLGSFGPQLVLQSAEFAELGRGSVSNSGSSARREKPAGQKADWKVETGSARMRFLSNDDSPSTSRVATSPATSNSSSRIKSTPPAPSNSKAKSRLPQALSAVPRELPSMEASPISPSSAKTPPKFRDPQIAPTAGVTAGRARGNRKDSSVIAAGYVEPLSGVPGAIRLVQNVEPNDVLSDPFADNSAESQDTTQDVQLETQAPAPATQRPPELFEQEEPRVSPRTNPRRARDIEPDEAPLPPPDEREDVPPPPRSPFLMPDDPSMEGDENAQPPCDRIHNERNCCGEDAKCETARKTLKSSSIKDISLDITPSIKPDAKSAEEVEKHKTTTLAMAPSRTWRDRNGQVLAVGRFRDLVHNRAVIETNEREMKQFPVNELSDDDRCFVAAWWGIPTECLLASGQAPTRAWVPLEFNWKASALCHKPLYFEEVQLERYGHTTGPFAEPFVSGAHFFMNVAFLPYKMGINPPGECQYALGYYRPGSCAPYLLPPTPISLRAALLQAGVVTGGVFIVP